MKIGLITALLLLPCAALAQGMDSILPNLTSAALQPALLKPSAKVSAEFQVTLPPGYHINEKAPSKVTLKLDGRETSQKLEGNGATLSLDFPKRRKFSVHMEASVYFCREGNVGMCQVQSFSLTRDVSASDKGDEAVVFPATVSPKEPGTT